MSSQILSSAAGRLQARDLFFQIVERRTHQSIIFKGWVYTANPVLWFSIDAGQTLVRRSKFNNDFTWSGAISSLSDNLPPRVF